LLGFYFLSALVVAFCSKNVKVFFYRPAGRKTLGKNDKEILRV